MEDALISPPVLAAVFMVVAFFYSAVGLGGGSSYTAILAVSGVAAPVIPMISLSLNILVTTSGSFNFIRKGHVRWNLIGLFLAASLPMAYLGGSIRLPKDVFYWLLFLSLIVAAFRIYRDSPLVGRSFGRWPKIAVAVLTGGVLGFLAGAVGIGGGIYLVPLIILLRLGNAKEAAACGSLFVLFNSLTGFVARFAHQPVDFMSFWLLIAAVMLGGTAGSLLGADRFSANRMQKILGSILLVAIFLLGRKIFFVG